MMTVRVCCTFVGVVTVIRKSKGKQQIYSRNRRRTRFFSNSNFYNVSGTMSQVLTVRAFESPIYSDICRNCDQVL